MIKLFQYTYYFFRSLYYRGLVNTFKLLSYENKYEKQLGINTHSIVNLDKLTLAGLSSEQNHHYQGASYYILFKVFEKLPNQLKNKGFIDFGCGKGRAIFVAEQCSFTKLIGVDIAKELIDEANENKKNYTLKNKNSSIAFIYSDATTFDIPSDACVFYFFNPFGEDIMRKVLTNVKSSVAEFPREIKCIYLNPKHDKVFYECGFKMEQVVKNNRYTEAIIYTL